jgi:ABC-type cobalamin/Fe3+-siderophores transport system ATPase subunit
LSRSDTGLTVADVRYGFPQRPDFLGPLTLRAERGELLGIIGPNGAGKTTLVRLLAGILSPHSGSVCWDGVDLHRLPLRERARRVAYLPQKPPADLPATALEVVLMGRFPHRTYQLFESQTDTDICRRCMEVTATWDLADRVMETLSGGEAQRVHLAAALAQEPELLLLDEPTSALDLYHQLATFDLLVRLTRERRMACVVVTHDLNLAGRHADRLALLDRGALVAAGPPDEILTDERLAPVYGVRFVRYRRAPHERPWILPEPPAIATEAAR